MRFGFTCFSLLLSLFLFGIAANAQSTQFTYQGSLTEGGTPSNGQYDLKFRLYSALSGGTQAGGELLKDDLQVAGGVFTVSLDFGDQFTAAGTRWLEIEVRPGASTGAYTLLSPRQQVSSSPFAIQTIRAQFADVAANAQAVGGIPAAQIVSTTDPRLTDARTPTPGSASYIQNTSSPQTANFNVNGTGTATTLSGGVVNAVTHFSIGGTRVFKTDAFNVFAGVSAGAVNTGGGNTFVGGPAGSSNTSGANNSFFGSGAGEFNATGSRNSYFGFRAGRFGIGSDNGLNNTAVGADAGRPGSTNSTFIGASATANGSLVNATAVGANAFVTQSNSLVLGSINGQNFATADTRVGIGVTNPSYKLHINDPANAGLRVQTNTGGGTLASFGGFGDFAIDSPGTAGGRLTLRENGSFGFGTNATTRGFMNIIAPSGNTNIYMQATGAPSGINIGVAGSPTNAAMYIAQFDGTTYQDRVIVETSGLVNVPGTISMGGTIMFGNRSLIMRSDGGQCYVLYISSIGVLTSVQTNCPAGMPN